MALFKRKRKQQQAPAPTALPKSYYNLSAINGHIDDLQQQLEDAIDDAKAERQSRAILNYWRTAIRRLEQARIASDKAITIYLDEAHV